MEKCKDKNKLLKMIVLLPLTFVSAQSRDEDTRWKWSFLFVFFFCCNHLSSCFFFFFPKFSVVELTFFFGWAVVGLPVSEAVKTEKREEHIWDAAQITESFPARSEVLDGASDHRYLRGNSFLQFMVNGLFGL